jgi:hypothetical protein
MGAQVQMLARFNTALIAATLPLALAACSNSETTPLASAPPPPQVTIPPQPRPPLGAQGGIKPPPLNALGLRQTINAGIPSGQLVWNFRSAYNVAALDCLRPEHAAILANYKIFLKAQNKGLTAANKEVDLKFGTAQNRANVHAREVYMTQVYNFYALPPTLPAFCDAALAVSMESITVEPRNLNAFAAQSLPKLDRIFLMFYNSYDQYRNDLAAWQQRYMPSQVPVVPLVSVAAPDATARP